jgi:hypothetical protein
MMATRLVGLLLLLVMIACALLSWTMFTGWGLLASYVGSHKGGLAPESELDAAEAKALRMFWSMVALQVIMFASSGFFVRSLTKGGRSRFWPSLKNWVVGLLLGAGVDGLVIASMFYRQTRG